MTKNKPKIFNCSKCDAQYPKWTGRCSTCGNWGTISEEITNNQRKIKKESIDKTELIDLQSSSIQKYDKIKTKLGEFDRVLGGGIVQGSLILLGGEPGIGKSTLILQICEKIDKKILYVSGEESASQIKMRTDRLNIRFNDLQFLANNNIEQIISFILEIKPEFVLIDSIQTLYSNELPSEAGSVNQVRVCTIKLLEISKKFNIPIIIVGHITKEGTVAGPKTLEHLVDSVVYLEGSKTDNFRLLRCTKNRFGATNELAVFDMSSSGLIEVKNPSELFLPHNQETNTGSVITCIMEGSRPFLIEIQALVSKTLFGYPQRKTSGFDQNRLQMLIAVLMKRAHIPLINQDVHLNVTGGLKINETGADLAVCLAIISSLKEISIKSNTIIIGEIGLGGEIRTVFQIKKRIEEAQKLKFKKIITPVFKTNKKNLTMVKNLEQAIKNL